jgi:hypothetical protein
MARKYLATVAVLASFLPLVLHYKFWWLCYCFVAREYTVEAPQASGGAPRDSCEYLASHAS